MATSKPNSVDKHLHELEAQDAKRVEFFMAASHQLKSPVAIIQWCLECVLENKSLAKSDEAMVRKALIQANGMSQLIKDMLHLFRMVNKKAWENEFVPVDLSGMIEQVVTQYQDVAHKRGIHLVMAPSEVLPKVLADESYLRQVVINLIDNALKYSPKDTTVTVTSVAKRDGSAEFSVKDQGIGISPADQAQLFKEFFRTQAAQDMTSEGTGLGLVLVKNIVEEFGGTIEVKSALHRGTVFTVNLPGAGK